MDITKIHKFKVFADLTNNQMADVTRRLKIITVPDGTQLFRENDKFDGFYVIVTGRISILKDLQGQEQLLAVLHEGESIGEMGVCEPDSVRSASATAKGECQLLKLDGRFLDDLDSENPAIALRITRSILRIVADRLRSLDQHYALTKSYLDKLKESMRSVGVTFPL